MKENEQYMRSRALTSTFASDLIELRALAVRLLDEAVADSNNPLGAVMVAFNCSHVTARKLLAARKRLTKSGKRKGEVA